MALGSARQYPLQCRNARSRLQGTLDGRGHHPHHQIDYGHQAHLPRCNETIRGHVFCSFLALLLKTELERRMKFADLKCEWAQIIRGLEALQQVEVAFQDKRFVLRSQLTSEASAALRATGVAAPPTLRELS
jgi:hypothetical protein